MIHRFGNHIKGYFKVTHRRERNRGTLWAAIQGQRVIEFDYHGGHRTVEPFALGVTLPGDADNESLICYQTEGYSEFNSVTGWKLYRISEMEEIRVLQERFDGDRPGYDPDSIDMAEIYICVRPERKAPAPDIPTERVPRYLTHNELMRRFRDGHPLPL